MLATLDWPRILLSFVLVFGLLGLTLWGLRRWSRFLLGKAPDAHQGIRVTESLRLTPRHRLLIIEADGQRVLIGLSPQGLQTLVVLTPPVPTAASRAPWSAVEGRD
jgi:flagellar protein FliO/FliZ